MIRPYAFRYAWRGIVLTFREEANFRVHLVVAEAILYLAFVERVGAVVWAVLFLAVGFVLALECINTAIERAVDLAADKQTQPLAAAAKDAAAGAVLSGSAAAAAVGLALLWGRLSMLSYVFSNPLDYVGLGVLAVLVVLTLRPLPRKG